MENGNVEHSAATHCYAVRVIRHVIASDGCEQIERNIVLPFAPMVGLKLGYASYDDHTDVEEVAFIVALQRFEIVVEDYEDMNDSLAVLVPSFTDEGWTVSA